MKKEGRIIPLILVLILFFGSISLILAFPQWRENIACKNIGFEGRGYDGRGGNFCEDSEGNLHYVKFTGFWNVKAKEISVGNVRVVEK